MFTIVDFIKNIVASLEFTEYVENITQTSTETQFDTCRTHQVTKGNYILINGIKYKVKDFEINSWISVSGVVPLPFESYTILAPNFFNGTPMMVSNVLADIRDWKKKLPMVYLLEVIREQRFNSRTNKLDRISDLRIFFLMSSNFEDWDISQHYDLAIEPMDNFLNDFIHALRYNAKVGEFDEYETINRANFGVYISKPSKRSGKYEDNITKLIDENVSGVELRINLPIQKNPCFSFPPDCPIPTPPPLTFQNLFSVNFDGVDDYTNASINIDAYKVATIRSFNFWVKINTLNTFTPLISGFGKINLFRYANNFGINQGRLQWSLEGLTNHLNGNWVKSELVDGNGIAPNIADGNWHNVSFYNAVDSQANNVNMTNCKIYLDGTLLNNDIVNTGSTAIRGFSNGGFVVGAGSAGGSSGQIYLDGNIDEVAYWDNSELTAIDVTAIYNSGVPTDLNLLPTIPNGWYRNGDPTGQASYPTIIDEGINNNPSAMINMSASDIETNSP